ncbi:hypothetical protein ACFL6S_20705, partial [Candidatus Poribacteria bacterium]
VHLVSIRATPYSTGVHSTANVKNGMAIMGKFNAVDKFSEIVILEQTIIRSTIKPTHREENDVQKSESRSYWYTSFAH